MLVNETYPEDLVRHVAASTYIRRRHAELKDKNWKNDEIWPLLAAELGARSFGAPELTERQLRRMVYG